MRIIDVDPLTRCTAFVAGTEDEQCPNNAIAGFVQGDNEPHLICESHLESLLSVLTAFGFFDLGPKPDVSPSILSYLPED